MFHVSAFEVCYYFFPDMHIALKISVIYISTADSLVLFPFSSSLVLSLCGYIHSRLSINKGSSVSGLRYLYLHLYNHTTPPTDPYCSPYLANFIATVDGLRILQSKSSETYNLTLAPSPPTVVPCNPILKLLFLIPTTFVLS